MLKRIKYCICEQDTIIIFVAYDYVNISLLNNGIIMIPKTDFYYFKTLQI